MDSTTYSHKIDEVVTLLVGGHPGTAAVRFNRLVKNLPNMSETTIEVALKSSLANRVGLVKVDKFWGSFSMARTGLTKMKDSA